MGTNKLGRFIRILTLFALLFTTGSAVAQSASYSVIVDRLTNNSFPTLDAYVSVLDVQGFPITGLSRADFNVMEDGVPVQDVQVSSYSNTEETLAIVLAIDTSGSMDSSDTPTPLDNAVEAAKNFVSQLSSQDLVAVITFSDEVILQSELTADKDKILGILDSLEPIGSTAISEAIVETVDVLKNRSERRAIILLTDGQPYGDQVPTFDQAFAHASAFKIPIYPIGFGEVDENQLKALAEVTGGTEQIKPDSLALTTAFDNILNLFREQYHLQVTSGITPDNKEHLLEVSVDYEGGVEKAEHLFIARDPVMLTITAPESGDTLNGIVNITAEVDGLNPITDVDFFVDDTLITSLNEEPYTAEWDTTEFVTGEHALSVHAADALGFKDEETLDVLVELQRQDWIYWLIGLVVLAAAALFISLGLRKKTTVPVTTRQAVLVEQEGMHPGQSWPLSKNRVSLGRKAAANDIALKGLSASREHAVIERTQQGYFISAVKTDNPLTVNGKTTQRSKLNSGDTIMLGESKFRFEHKE